MPDEKPTFGDLTEALGGIVVVWGMVEDGVRKLLNTVVLNNERDKQISGIVMAESTFRAQLNMLRKAAHVRRPDSDWTKRLDELLREIGDSLHAKRNRYIHDLWTEDGSGVIVKVVRGQEEVTAKRKNGVTQIVWQEPKPAILEEIWDFFERISCVYESLLELDVEYLHMMFQGAEKQAAHKVGGNVIQQLLGGIAKGGD